MRIYSKSNFCLGLAYLALAAASGSRAASQRENGFLVFMMLAWAALGVAYLYYGMNREKAEKSREASARNSAAARELFGKWRFLAEGFGVALAVLSLVLMVLGRGGNVPIILLFIGVIYTLVICFVISEQAKK